ncbi:oligopeptide ABC transporter substrate-binding protein [Clostridium algidicarnis]|uniref:Peptide/nickel transport system substrate-binding protein n=1 Tax=Clostridium algidicarnis DSM 15099 TaxID=1121295 RepID=A0A2S6FZJ2_9CLOT|nr:oligopeptide ABC transporter substrate-binding protein [Clostridium algidicarnis]MBB6698032.1 oligopeptide ABC transporter substrate-binding protein [Clostridium algidicarnis]MCB2285950.1 oligopeptide ABC transporter substrate-binding protein [Clostridium algidicarnis]PPK48984.1 peptide/nickel transport system substrate-binding protein [Clostridium algidicarnis DSM 15099]
MKKSLKFMVPLLLASTLLLAACNKKPAEGGGPATGGEKDNALLKIELPHPDVLQKEGKTIGGTLNVALVTSTPFEGIFNTFLYSNKSDSDIMSPMLGAFMKSGENHEIVDGGYCDVKFDKEAKKATYKINKDLTWSDGVPVTADDLIFVYESVANKDYEGIRFDSDYRNVVGIEEYNKGTAETISGLNKIDDKTLEVSFKKYYPGILWGAGLTFNAEPKHYLGDIPIKEMESHDKVRVKPLSCGPFVVSNIVPGESVEYIPNPHWFGEKPKVDKIVYKRTSPDTIVEALKAGTFDVVDGITVDSYKEYKDLSNIELLSSVQRSYGYVGFKLGKWDGEAKEVKTDTTKKMSDVKLRQAIAYAMDNKEVCEVFYNGLRLPANSVMDPAHATFWNSKLAGYNYDPEKAKKMLDDAGYKDVDNDGMREDTKGNKLKINFLSMSGGEIAEPLAQFYVQGWRDVGLDVSLQNGRLVDMNAFYDMVQNDNEEIDMYMGGWGTGSNPDPSGLYGRQAQMNYTRFATEENDKLLDAIASEDAFSKDGINQEYLVKAYHDWQQYIHDEVPVAPTNFRYGITATNKRVNSWDLRTVSDWGWEKVGLLSDAPEKAK